MITLPVFPRRKQAQSAGFAPGLNPVAGGRGGVWAAPSPPPLLAASRGAHLQIGKATSSPPCSWASEGGSYHFQPLNWIYPTILLSILQIYIKASLHHRFWAGCGGYDQQKRQIYKHGEVTWQYALRREPNRKWGMAWRAWWGWGRLF